MHSDLVSTQYRVRLTEHTFGGKSSILCGPCPDLWARDDTELLDFKAIGAVSSLVELDPHPACHLRGAVDRIDVYKMSNPLKAYCMNSSNTFLADSLCCSL